MSVQRACSISNTKKSGTKNTEAVVSESAWISAITLSPSASGSATYT